MNSPKKGWNRREFFQATGSVALLSAVQTRTRARGISIVVDLSDNVANAAPAHWAAKELEQSLQSRGISVHRCERIAQANRGDLCILAAGAQSNVAVEILKEAHTTLASVPEALAMVPGTIDQRKVLLVCGYDARGLVYALLDLVDRVQNASDPLQALAIRQPITE